MLGTQRKGRWSYFQRPSSNLAPRSGHSSQPLLDAKDRNAQVLPTLGEVVVPSRFDLATGGVINDFPLTGEPMGSIGALAS
jgi:hypothetical protein